MKLNEFNIENYTSLLKSNYKYIEILEATGREIEVSENFFKVLIFLTPHKERPTTENIVLGIKDLDAMQMTYENEKVFFRIEMPE